MVDPKKVKEDVETVVTAELLERHGKLWAARYLRHQPDRRLLLHQLMLRILSPLKSITDESTVEWLRWLMAGEKTPESFAEEVRTYDNAQRCGMVWTADFVAYRCRTCGVSPCMSLCAECFQRGNHEGHDYNMFRSQAGGACDCGDPYVMKGPGFCSLHGQLDPDQQRRPPDALMEVPRQMMPYIFQRLLVYLRINSRLMEGGASNDSLTALMSRLDVYLSYLQELCNMRAAMRSCMTHVLISNEVYREMDQESVSLDDSLSDSAKLLQEAYRNYLDAVSSMPNPDLPAHLRSLSPALGEKIRHSSMLDELVFWTYKYEFPTKLVCFLLNMLPEQKYKECFTRAFVLHYARISQMLAASNEPDPLTNRVVHVSVQLFSNELLAVRMTEQLHLLHAMVVSLTYMTSRILISSQLHDTSCNTHKVANCADKIMKNHCYWPLVSDLSNVLGHKPVSLYFLSDDQLLQMWFSYLSMYQGMNVNFRQLDAHVDMEPSTYYAAFSAELEGSATPMWALLTHLREPGTADLTKRLLRHAYTALQQWHDSIGCPQTYDAIVNDHSMDLRCTFHLPLHRYVALIISEATKRQGLRLSELLPHQHMLVTLVSHLLKLQVSFYEICAGLWVRNGNQMRGQTMTYTQCHFCCSMVDPDIFLLQLGAVTLDPDKYLTLVFKKFHVWDWLSFAPNATNSFLESDQEIAMVEACLTFLATLLCIRTCAGMPEDEMARLEIATQLCMGDKTHSQLTELLPEKSETMNSPALFESALAQVSRYRGPASEASGNMQQGIYGPKQEVWHTLYDPIYVMLRAMVRKDFQTSMDRFTTVVKSTGEYTDSRSSPWPPYKVPPTPADDAPVPDVRRLLHCNTFYGAMLAILRRCVSEPAVSEQLMALVVFLLEMAVRKPEKEPTGKDVYNASVDQPYECVDLQFTDWFRTPWSVDNLRRVVDNVTVKTQHTWPSSSSSDSGEMLMESMSVGDGDDADDLYGGGMTGGDARSGPGGGGTSPRTFVLPPLLAGQVLPALLAGTEVGRLPSGVASTASEPPDAHLTAMMASGSAAAAAARPEPPYLHPALTGSADGNAVALPPEMSRVLGAIDFSTGQTAPSPEQQLPLPLVAYSPGMSPPPAPSAASHDLSWYGRREFLRTTTTTTTSVAFGDSIVSLLLKLHSKLTDQPDSYRLPSDQQLDSFKESRIGNGPHFIGQLLTFIARKDPLLKEHITQTRNRLWPRAVEEEASRTEDREARRKMARERQQRLMRQFANRQRQFQQQMETEEPDSVDGGEAVSSDQRRRVQEYDCVICGQSSASTETRPFGLVVLLQATSVLAHQRLAPAPLQLPVDEAACRQLRHQLAANRAGFVEMVHDRLGGAFENKSWLLTMNIGVSGGVHVQTCGHHLHLDCHRMYVLSLTGHEARQQSISVQRGEYSCPLCRQQCNGVLPLLETAASTMVSPSIPSPVAAPPTLQMAAVRSELVQPPCRPEEAYYNIMTMLNQTAPPEYNHNFWESISKAMECMTHITYPKYRNTTPQSPGHENVLLFVTSIARTNLEMEVVQRGGRLLNTAVAGAQLVPSVKRSSLAPLLTVLGFNAKVLAVRMGNRHLPAVWALLNGLPPESRDALTVYQPEVPMLVRDPCSLLLLLLLTLPMPLPRHLYTCLVQALYNLFVAQSCASISMQLPRSQRVELMVSHHLLKTSPSHVECLGSVVGLIVDVLGNIPGLYADDSQMDPAAALLSTAAALQDDLRARCLPFLRVTAVLQQHLYQQTLPDVPADRAHAEFGALCDFVQLGAGGAGGEDPCARLAWGAAGAMVGGGELVVRAWCEQYRSMALQWQPTARDLLRQPRWFQPHLLQLPREYKHIFLFYHRRQCQRCGTVPKEPTVCLVCGVLVCLRGQCCKQDGTNETVAHSVDCGAGTSVFLAVDSCMVIIIRGRRACLWGSVYLDSFGEEDRELKRGRPLFLCQERYDLLQNLWVAHGFDNTRRRWIWHKEML